LPLLDLWFFGHGSPEDFLEGRPRLHGAEGIPVEVKPVHLTVFRLVGQCLGGGLRFARGEDVGQVVRSLLLLGPLRRDLSRGLGSGDGIVRALRQRGDPVLAHRRAQEEYDSAHQHGQNDSCDQVTSIRHRTNSLKKEGTLWTSALSGGASFY